MTEYRTVRHEQLGLVSIGHSACSGECFWVASGFLRQVTVGRNLGVKPRHRPGGCRLQFAKIVAVLTHLSDHAVVSCAQAFLSAVAGAVAVAIMGAADHAPAEKLRTFK
jgi:hypothetical protein